MEGVAVVHAWVGQVACVPVKSARTAPSRSRDIDVPPLFSFFTFALRCTWRYRRHYSSVSDRLNLKVTGGTTLDRTVRYADRMRITCGLP